MSVPSHPFPDDVRRFVEATPWRFAKTYAATWPHEYVVQNAENAPMILALARHIFERGTEGRFFSQIRKYHHEGGKVYWSMDSTPEATDAHQPLRRGPDLRGATRCWDSAETVNRPMVRISVRPTCTRRPRGRAWPCDAAT